MDSNLITFERGELTKNALALIQLTEKNAADAIRRRDEMRAALLEAMEKAGVKKFESDNLTLSYIAGAERETFDKKAFKEDYGEVYFDYVKISKTKPGVRITIKEPKDE